MTLAEEQDLVQLFMHECLEVSGMHRHEMCTPC